MVSGHREKDLFQELALPQDITGMVLLRAIQGSLLPDFVQPHLPSPT